MIERVVVESVVSVRSYGVLFSGRIGDGTLLRVRCGFPVEGVEVGASFEVAGNEGTFVDAYGASWQQIDAASVKRIAVAGSLVRPYLAKLPGFGPIRAERIWAAFGYDALTALADPSGLIKVAAAIEPQRPTVGAAVAARVAAAIRRDTASLPLLEARQDFYRRLEDAGVTDRRAAERLWHICGDRTWRSRLMERPYFAAAHLPWKQADHLGQAMLRSRGEDPLDHPDRLIGAVDSTFQDCFRRGDTAISRDDLVALLVSREVDAPRAAELHRDRGYSIGNDVVRPRGMAMIEDMVAEGLRRRDLVEDAIDVAVVRAAESAIGMTLNDGQRQAVAFVLARRVAVLSGGAGTGKTATTAVICAACEALGGHVELTCISGKGALVLSRATGRSALTCAAFLQDHGGRPSDREDATSRNPRRRPSARTLLIVDEASMLDTYTLQRLLAALHPQGRLLFVGDPGQLPPVSPGCVFHDLCREASTVTRLERVMRQAGDSVIPLVAADVRAGRIPDLPAFDELRPGAFLIDCASDSAARIAEDLHDQMLATCEIADCLHLAARNATVAAINESRIARRQDGTPECRLGPFATVAHGDPVICRRNRYPDDLRNGQTGIVSLLDEDGVEIIWDGREAPARVAGDLGADIGLAWAMTVHRAQGSSARLVIVRLERTPLVTREWIYTALTRAVETVVFVGPRGALADGIGRRVHRFTGFQMSWDLTRKPGPAAAA